MLKLLYFSDVAGANMSLNDVIFLKIFDIKKNWPKQGIYHFPWCSFNFCIGKYLFLEEIDTNMIPTQGTSLSSAIQTGLSAFSDDDSKFKVLVLISDGNLLVEVLMETHSR